MRHVGMPDRIAERFDVPVYSYMSMDFSFNPTTFVASEQPRLVIREVSAVTHPLAQHVILARDAKEVNICRSGCDRPFYFIAQPRPDNLVGVDLQHPFVVALRQSPILLPG